MLGARIRMLRSRFALPNSFSSRKIYTYNIDPYPVEYISKKWPSQEAYRETFEFPPWWEQEQKYGMWLMRIFWTYFFMRLFNNPDAVTGHFHPPDPATFTDEQLGIPPDEVGSYDKWLAARGGLTEEEKALQADADYRFTYWGIMHYYPELQKRLPYRYDIKKSEELAKEKASC